MNIMTAPTTGISSTSLPTAKLDAMAVDYIKQNANEDSDFGTVDGGNMGLAAYSLSPSKSKALLSAAMDIYPGARELKKFQFNSNTTNLCPQSKSSGVCGTPVVGINSVDLTSAKEELFQAACPGADQDDWGSALTGIFSKERHLKLGEGSADHLWWT